MHTIEWRSVMAQKNGQSVSPAETRKNRIVTGLVMVFGGIALYASLRMDISINVVLIIGLAFLTLYFYRQSAGFLIPGCLLFGLGIRRVIHNNFEFSRGWLLGLGIGFVFVFLISLAYEHRKDYWWTLIPGGLMIIAGSRRYDELLVFLYDNWPLLIIVIGFFILVGAFRKPATPNAPPLTPPPPSGENVIE